MARIIALDIGEKRTGIAVSDELQLIASGLTTVDTESLVLYLKKYLERESVERFVVGLPRRFSGESSHVEGFIVMVIKKLQDTFPQISISRVDERFTSKIAAKTMMTIGLKKKARQNKATIDQISATLILQSHLNYQN